MRRDTNRLLIPGLVIVVFLLGMAGQARAGSMNLVVNGTFDTNLNGWDIVADTGVIWNSGTAWVGAPGTPGTAVFSQEFNILSGTSGLSISFDYEWQVDKPSTQDFFTVELIYESTSGTIVTQLLNQGSDSGAFGTTVSFSGMVSLIDLVAGPNNGKIQFTLNENNTPKGTRVELDNVGVYAALPEPSSLALLGFGLLSGGLVTFRKRFR